MKKIILLAVVLTVSSVAFAQTRSALIHLKDGAVKEYYCDNIDSITFTPSVTFSKEMVATDSYNVYYGGKGYYYVNLSDAPMVGLGMPTKVGQTIVRFYPIAKKSLDSNNAILPSGRYDSALGTKSGALFDGGNTMDLLYCTGFDDNQQPLGYQWHMNSAIANVTYNSDKTYDIDFRCHIDDTSAVKMGFENTHVTYSGPLTFKNEDPESYIMLSGDVVVNPASMGGGYYNASPGQYGYYSLTFYNTPVDDGGFVAGAGEVLSVALITASGSPMDISKLPGVYTVCPAFGPYEPGHFMAGTIYNGMPMGTNYMTYDEKGNSTRLMGFVKDGTITITKEGTKLRVVCDLNSENDYKITMNFADEESKIIDQSKKSIASTPENQLSNMFSGQQPALIFTKVE